MFRFESELMRWCRDEVPHPSTRCSFGITEAIAAAAAFVPELAGATAGADALAGAGVADAGLVAGGDALAGAGLAGGLGDLAGGGLGTDAAGLGSTAASAGAGAGTGAAASPLAGLSTAALGPSTAAGVTPAAAAPIDLASAAAAPGGDVTAAFTGNLAPASSPFAPSTAGSGVWSDSTEILSQGLNPTTAAPGGIGPAAAPTSDLSALLGGGTGPAAPGATPATATAGLTNAGAGASGVAAPTSSTGFFDSLTAGATKAVTSNPLGIGLSAAGLGYSVLQGQKVSANEQALQAAAGTQAGQGQELASYIQSGQLPPGMAAQVANATAAAKAAIISGYASRGQNANPSQNSALAQELAQVDMNALAMQGQLANQLLQSGLQESNMSDQLYAQLIGIDQTQAKNTGAAIANFASALAGGPKTIQIGNQVTT